MFNVNCISLIMKKLVFINQYSCKPWYNLSKSLLIIYQYLQKKTELNFNYEFPHIYYIVSLKNLTFISNDISPKKSDFYEMNPQ